MAGVPRRATPDPLSLSIGARIRQLREEAGLTQEQLAYESDLGSKGHLSNIENGLVHPTVHTLQALSDRLEVELADFVTFSDASARGRLLELTRRMPASAVKTLLQLAEELFAQLPFLRAAERPARYREGRRRRAQKNR